MSNQEDSADVGECSQSLGGQQSETTPFSSVEYFSSLEKWIREIYFIQNFNVLWYNSLLVNQATGIPPALLLNPTIPRTINIRTTIRTSTVVECRLPSIWKRLAAEFIDFLILFFIKILATYSIMDFFESGEIDSLIQKTMKLDYEAAMELTSELMAIEVAHRITVCLYETFWLYHGFGAIEAGATPGKKFFNLRVVRCDKITEIHRDNDDEVTIMVEPGTPLTAGKALLRSVVKNFILAAFLPLTFMFMCFQNNRTGYDMITQSLVIEKPTGRYR